MSNIYTDDDNRLSLATGNNITIVAANMSNGTMERFLIEREQGRGRSSIVYWAMVNAGEALERPVLLKEFYPIDYTEYLEREPKTGELRFHGPHGDLDAEDGVWQGFWLQRERFTSTCMEQQHHYATNMQSTDELFEIQGIYALGESLYTVMRAVGGCSWDQVKEESAYQILETGISVLHELKTLHENDLLHGDIKPENIYIFRKTRQHVGLLDFESLQVLEDGALTGIEVLSYSDGYAAPEILDALQCDVLDREDYYSCITPKADLYALAAVLYTRLTGCRVPENTRSAQCKRLRAEAIERLWQQERQTQFRNVPEHVRVELIHFFDVMLARNFNDRYGLSEMEQRLHLLMIHVAPNRYVVSPCHRPSHSTEFYVGRRKDCAAVKQLLEKNGQMMLVWGEGGIGKSELMRKVAWDLGDTYDFFWLTFDGSLKQTVANMLISPEDSSERSRETDVNALYERNLSCLAGYRNTAVLVIDNCDPGPEDEEAPFLGSVYADLSRLELRVIFTSRTNMSGTDAELRLNPLSEDELLTLTLEYYNHPEAEASLRSMIRAAHYNTLLVQQMARMLGQSWGSLTPERLSEALSLSYTDQDDTPTAEALTRRHLLSLFELTAFSVRSKKILACATLYPASGIEAGMLLRCYDEAEQDRMQLMVLNGWLNRSSDNMISIHPLIREVGLIKLNERMNELCSDFYERYLSEFSLLKQPEKTRQCLQRAAIVSNAADYLKDTEGKYAETAGLINYQAGRYRHALLYFQKQWECFLSNNPAPETMRAMMIMDRIASSALKVGEYSHAIYYSRTAIMHVEREKGEGRPEMLPYYINLGNIYLESNAYDEAYRYYSKAWNAYKAGNSGDESTEITLWKSFGTLYSRMGNNIGAASCIDRALKLADGTPGVSPEIRASILETAAWLHHKFGHYKTALDCSREAVRIYTYVLGENHPRTVISNINVASALMDCGQLAQAHDILIEMNERLEQTVGYNHPYMSKTCFLLFQVDMMRRKDRSADVPASEE